MDHPERVLGPVMVGVGVNTYLYGLTIFQYAAYNATPFKDPFSIKLPVALLFLVDFYQSLVAIYMLWNYVVANFSNASIIDVPFWAITIIPISSGICGLIAHTFQGYRIFKMTGIQQALYIIIPMSVLVVGSAIATAIVGLAEHVSLLHIISHDVRIRPAMSLWLALQTIFDTGISVTLLLVLLKTGSFMPKGDPLNRALRAIVQSGMLAATFSLAALLSYVASFNSTIYIVFSLAVGRLYSSLVLDSLLARGAHFRNSSSGAMVLQGHPNEPPQVRKRRESVWSSSRSNATDNTFSLSAIHVQTETFTDAATQSKSRPGTADRTDIPIKFN
jgi:hypothetical protein